MAWIDPEVLRQRLEDAQALINAKDFDRAIVDLELIVTDAPDYELGLRALGYVYNLVGRTADAVHLLERAVDQDPLYHQIINVAYLRTQVSLKILAGLSPNDPWPEGPQA